MIAFAPERPTIVLPKALLAGAVALAALAFAAAGLVRWGGLPPAGVTEAPGMPAAVSRELRFSDLNDGGVAVHDATTGRLVATLAPGTNGFIRGTLRGLARERHRRSIGAARPLRLLGRSDGSLALEDPATSIRIEVGSFGPDNEVAFRRLLAAP